MDITPKSEWKNLSVTQLYDTKYKMMDVFFNMRQVNASFAGQYNKFISEIDELIRVREAEKEAQD